MKGLDHWRNKNGFYVAQIHYSADPNKDPDTEEGRRWLNEAKRGMSEAAFRKEYEIDWFALSGELIFPEFDKNVHLIEPFEIPKHWPIYQGIDHGVRNPTAVIWAAVSPDNDIICYREYYHKNMTVKQHAEQIRILEKHEKENNCKIIRYIDPATSQRNGINLDTIMGEFAKNGIYCIPGTNNVEAGLDRISKYLRIDKSGKPRLYLFNTLRNTINEFTNYRWKEITPTQAEKSNPKDQPGKVNDHLLDALRYLLMGNPHYYNTQVKFKPKRSAEVWDNKTTGY